MTKINASFVFSGFGDYFGGWGTYPGKSALLYAFYNHCSTLKDIFESAIEDFHTGPAGEDLPEDITENDIRSALLDCLTEQGRKDYEEGALSEFAIDYASANDLEAGVELEDIFENNQILPLDESPVCIFLIECEEDND